MQWQTPTFLSVNHWQYDSRVTLPCCIWNVVQLAETQLQSRLSGGKTNFCMTVIPVAKTGWYHKQQTNKILLTTLKYNNQQENITYNLQYNNQQENMTYNLEYKNNYQISRRGMSEDLIPFSIKDSIPSFWHCLGNALFESINKNEK